MADEIDITSDIQDGSIDAARPTPAGTVPAHGSDSVPQNAQSGVKTDTQTRQPKTPTLRDTLTSAFNGSETDNGNSDRGDGRKPNGQFAPKDTAQSGAADQNAAPAQTVSVPKGIDPTQFAALPAEMQQHVARTMEAVENKAAQYSGYEQLEQVIAPRRQAWALNGMSEHQAISQLFALSDFATQSPSDFVKWFAGQHGIDLAAQVADNGGSDEFVDPKVTELRQQVDRLTQQLTGFVSGQDAARHNSLVDFTAQFASEVGTDGQPLRPYFAELGNAIVPYVQQAKAENPNGHPAEILKVAYDRAVWANPDTRAKLLTAQEAARLASQREETARRVNAGSSVSGGAPAGGSTTAKLPGNGSVRDTLQAAFAASR